MSLSMSTGHVHEPDCRPLANASFGVAKPSRRAVSRRPKPRQRFQEYFSLILRILNLAILNLSADILNLAQCISLNHVPTKH